MKQDYPKPKLQPSIALLMSMARALCPAKSLAWLDDMHYELAFIEGFAGQLRWVLGALGLAFKLRLGRFAWLRSPRSLVLATATAAALFAFFVVIPPSLRFSNAPSTATLPAPEEPVLVAPSPSTATANTSIGTVTTETPEIVSETSIVNQAARSSQDLEQESVDVASIVEAPAPPISQAQTSPLLGSSVSAEVRDTEESLAAVEAVVTPSAPTAEADATRLREEITQAEVEPPKLDSAQSAPLEAEGQAADAFGDNDNLAVSEPEGAAPLDNVLSDVQDQTSSNVQAEALKTTRPPFIISSLSLDPPHVFLKLNTETLTVRASDNVIVETKNPERKSETLKTFELKTNQEQSFSLPVILHTRALSKLELFAGNAKVTGIALQGTATIEASPASD